MTQLRLNFSDERAIPVDFAGGAEPDRARWAADTARSFCERSGIDTAHLQRLTGALVGLYALTDGDRRALLLVSADAQVLAPLTFTVADTQLSPRERGDFLWSPSALLPPTTALTETEHLGTGVSSTLLQREQERDFATRRWLFLGETSTVGALLGPVAPYGLSAVEETAEQVLQTSSLEGFVAVADPDWALRLEAAGVRVGDTWAV